MTDFTVIGGGIAGLVVARRLALGGRAVVLREASDHLGGTVARHRVAGLDLDAGAESFAVHGGAVARLASELGLESEQPAVAGAWLQPPSGAPRPLPATGVFGIPGRPLAPDVRAVLGLLSAVRAKADSVLPLGRIADDETIGSLVRRRMGRATLERLVAPVVHGVYSLDPDALSMDTGVPALRAALESRRSLAGAVRELRAAAPAGSAVAGLRGGMHTLVTALATELGRLDVEVRLGDRARLDDLGADVILAAPRAPGGRTVVLATLVVDCPELDAAPRGTGVLVASGAPGVRARALTHATAKWASLREAAQGRHVLRLSYDREPEHLAEVALADASALLGTAIPAGDFARVEWVRPTPASPPSGVTAVGETVAGSGLARIIAHAESTAERLLAD